MVVKTPPVICRLTPADTALAQGLLRVFADAFEEPDTYLGAVPSDAYFHKVLAQDHVIALAARSGETVVGGLVAYTLEKLEQQRSEIYIYDLAVATSHRRKGIATALIRAVQQIAANCHAHVISYRRIRATTPQSHYTSHWACGKRYCTSISNLRANRILRRISP